MTATAFLEPAGRLDEFGDASATGFGERARISCEAPAHRIEVQGPDPLRDPPGLAGVTERIVDMALPQAGRAAHAQHRDLDLVMRAFHCGHGFGEARAGLLEAAHIGEKEGLAGERISKADRDAYAAPVTPLDLDRFVEKEQRARIIAGGRPRLSQSRADLHDQRVVAEAQGDFERLFQGLGRGPRLAQRIIYVAEPVAGARIRGPMLQALRAGDGAREDRELVAGRGEHAGEAETFDDSGPAGGVEVAGRHPVERIERDPEMRLGAVERGGGKRPAAGALGIMSGHRTVIGGEIMRGERFERLLLAGRGGAVVQGPGDAEMERSALVQADRFVDDLAGEAMFEAEGPRPLAVVEKVFAAEGLNEWIRFSAAGDRLEQPAGNDGADYGRDPDEGLGCGRQARHSGFHQIGEPRRPAQRPLLRAAGRHGVAQFLDEKRIAAGRRGDFGDHEWIGRGEQAFDGGPRLGCAERRERDDFEPGAKRRRRAATGCHEGQKPRLPDAAQSGREIAAGVVGRMPIVDEKHEGLFPGRPLDELAERACVRSFPVALRREQPGEGLGESGERGIERGKPGLHLVRSDGAMAFFQAEHRARDVEEGVERTSRCIAFPPVDGEARHPRLAEQLFRQSGLANARRAFDDREMWGAGGGIGEPAAQQLEFGGASDERCAFDERRLGSAGDGEGLHRRVGAAQAEPLARRHLEAMAFGAERRLADEDFIGPGGGAQARGDVGRAAVQLEAAAAPVAFAE